MRGAAGARRPAAALLVSVGFALLRPYYVAAGERMAKAPGAGAFGVPLGGGWHVKRGLGSNWGDSSPGDSDFLCGRDVFEWRAGLRLGGRPGGAVALPGRPARGARLEVSVPAARPGCAR